MKCKLGLCSSNQACAPHRFTYNHEDWWTLIKICTLIFMIAFVPIMTYGYFDGIVHESLYPIIEGYNCGQLEEYIADRATHYSYAVHRFKWLC